MSFSWRWLLALLIAYGVMEGWAQLRFSLHNVEMPMGIRKNMGMNPFDAFKLRSGYSGTSFSGKAFETDEHGFRVGPHSHRLPPGGILLAGDSRVFGYPLPWEETLQARLEDGLGERVRLQAYPGGSVASFNHEMWTLGVFDRLTPQPKAVHYFYDRQDIYGDRDLRRELARKDGLWKRRVKLALGGYLWNRWATQFKTWNAGWAEPWPWEEAAPVPVSAPKGPPGSTPILLDPVSEAELLVLKEACAKRGVELVVHYLPRFLELYVRDSSMTEALGAFCRGHGITYWDGYAHFDERAKGEVPWLKGVFLDVHEGIHFKARVFEDLAKDWP